MRSIFNWLLGIKRAFQHIPSQIKFINKQIGNSITVMKFISIIQCIFKILHVA